MHDQNVIFSVVIPTYNRADKLRRCLDSLLNQTFKAFEVLVCDDGSKDETGAVAAEYSKKGLNLRYFYQENWGGPARPRNIGIAEASAPWVCFLDSDDCWYPEKLDVCKANLDGCDVIYHDFNIDGGSVLKKKIIARQLSTPVFRDLLVNGNTICTSGTCIKTALLRETGGFSEDRQLIAVEDFDLWLRIAAKGYTFKHLPAVLGSYWQGGGNITAKDDRQLKRINYVYGLHIPSLPPADQQAAKHMQAYLLAKVYVLMGDKTNARRFFRRALRAEKLSINIKSVVYLLKSAFMLRT